MNPNQKQGRTTTSLMPIKTITLNYINKLCFSWATAIEAGETPEPIPNSEVKPSFVLLSTALREGVGTGEAVAHLLFKNKGDFKNQELFRKNLFGFSKATACNAHV